MQVVHGLGHQVWSCASEQRTRESGWVVFALPRAFILPKSKPLNAYMRHAQAARCERIPLGVPILARAQSSIAFVTTLFLAHDRRDVLEIGHAARASRIKEVGYVLCRRLNFHHHAFFDGFDAVRYVLWVAANITGAQYVVLIPHCHLYLAAYNIG